MHYEHSFRALMFLHVSQNFLFYGQEMLLCTVDFLNVEFVF